MKVRSVDPNHSLKTTVQGAQMLAKREKEEKARQEALIEVEKVAKQVVIPQPSH